ncbi:MAG: monovalent cation/H+ antiporter complex subunit F [Actinomycetaceae bacterium]|nr:monovalent cation/H+ antiporter complex subunit F [Actinomycetaceae bacterium]
MNPLSLILTVSLVGLIATLFIALIRLILGPTTTDRAVASELLSVAGLGITAIVAVRTDRGDVLVLAIMFAMIGFLYAVTIGRFNERFIPDEEAGKPTPEQVAADDLRMDREAETEVEAESRQAIQEARASRSKQGEAQE